MSALELSGVPQAQYEQGTLFALQEVAGSTLRTIEKVKEEIKTANAMLSDVYHGNHFYENKEKDILEKKKELKTIEANINQASDVAGLKIRVKELREELKEKKVAISDYALEINRIGEVDEITIGEQVYIIQKSATLVKKKSL